MRRAAVTILGTVAALVLLLSFKTHATSSLATPPAASSTNTGSSTSSGTSTTGRTTAARTFTGDAVDTQFGPVQVQITVRGGKVTAVDAVEYPTSNPRDAQINAYAVPVLNQEAVAAGTANIDMVSGATFTSQGYLSSLQSALDKAGI